MVANVAVQLANASDFPAFQVVAEDKPPRAAEVAAMALTSDRFLTLDKPKMA